MNKLHNRTKSFKKNIAFFLILLNYIVQGQTTAENQIRAVFNQLVIAYDSPKTAPELLFMKIFPSPTTPALYENKKVKLDLQLYQLCQTFGKDSLNALSVVLSHELAHYYYEHDFCSDFAYAIQNKSVPFAKGLKIINKNQKVFYETQADDKGLFYAAMAGFYPFEIQPKILDAVYRFYKLKDINFGYPSKNERKAIAQNALTKAQKLFAVFQEAVIAKEQKEYDKSLNLFEIVNQDFPTRENYNNIGVLKTLKALKYKLLTKEEFDYPNRFLNPLEVDINSRLDQSGTRGQQDDAKQALMNDLLKSAQKDFTEAIRLDEKYTIAYINSACVYDLLGNPNGAISRILELPIAQQKINEAQRILAIGYYHADNEKKAEAIWKELKINN